MVEGKNSDACPGTDVCTLIDKELENCSNHIDSDVFYSTLVQQLVKRLAVVYVRAVVEQRTVDFTKQKK